MDVATDIFFHILMYVQMNRNIKKAIKIVQDLVQSISVDWMVADLNVSLQLIIKKEEEFKQTKWSDTPAYVTRQKSVSFTGR